MKLLYTLIAFTLLAIQPMTAQTRIASWNHVNTQNTTYPLNASAVVSDYIVSAKQDFSGLFQSADSRNIWINKNTAKSLNIANAPYLSMKLEIIGSIKLDRVVATGFTALGSSKVQLRWSVDNFQTSLGEFTNGPNSNYGLTSVNLASKPNVSKGTLEFRLYFYNSNDATNGNIVYFLGAGAFGSADATPAKYNTSSSLAIWYNEEGSLGTDERELKTAKLVVSPNPASDFVQVSGISKTQKYTIYSSAGTAVDAGMFSVNGNVDVRRLPKGMYILHLENGQHLKFIKK